MKTLTVTAGCQSCQVMHQVNKIKSSSKVWTIWNLKDIASNVTNSDLSSELYVQIYRNHRLLRAGSMIHKNVPFLLIYSQPKSTASLIEDVDKDIDEDQFDDDEDVESTSNNRVKRSANQYYGYNFENDNNILNNVEEQDPTKFQQYQLESNVNDFIKNGPMSLKPRKQVSLNRFVLIMSLKSLS